MLSIFVFLQLLHYLKFITTSLLTLIVVCSSPGVVGRGRGSLAETIASARDIAERLPTGERATLQRTQRQNARHEEDRG